MADEVARKDDNSVNTQLGVVDVDGTGLKPRKKEEIRKIRTTDKGAVKVDTGVKIIGGDEKLLSVVDLTDREIQEAQLVELRLISMKLDCLQPDDEEIDASELDQIDNETL